LSLLSPSTHNFPIVVLISGNGSNLQAIIDAISTEKTLIAGKQHKSPKQLSPIEIRAVISNRADAYGLERASKAGIHTVVLSDANYTSREDYDKKLQATIEQFQPQLIVLAGFMRILSEGFVSHYLGKMINIHPSLLPKFRGLKTHQRAIENGETRHGATVHFVTPELDGGPAILQAEVPVLRDDSANTLADRVLDMEHKIYPLVIRWIAEKKVSLAQNQVVYEGKPLTKPIKYPLEPEEDTAT